jgi:hypothetical protein
MKFENNWRFKTLEALEKKEWQPVDFDSFLIKRTHELRKKVLSDFTIEDLRIMIGQQIGLDYLIPLAIEVLTVNLFAEGDFYEGDLLQSVLKTESRFWGDNKQYLLAINSLIKNRESELSEKKIDLNGFGLK